MDGNQWLVLIIAFNLIGSFLVYEDSLYRYCTNSIARELTTLDVHCLLNSELRDPFIPIVFIFGIIIFPILSWLEPEKKIK